MKALIASFTAAALLATGLSAQGAIVFSDDFEDPNGDPDGTNLNVNDSQSNGNTNGKIDTSKWVRANTGFGSNRQGIVDESHGDFTDPSGEQAYAFRYTNSGITTATGVIGTYGSLAAGSIIKVTFDVVIDGHNDTTPYNAGLVTFADGVSRTDMNGGALDLADGPSARLKSISGNAQESDPENPGDLSYLNYQQVSFSFTVGDALEAGTAAASDDIALRIDGATSSAIIDNVSIDVTVVPEPGSLALMGIAALLIARRRHS